MIIEIITSELDFYITEKIRELRIKAGLDQVALAQKLGVSEGYIGNIENPKHTAKANIRMLARIANALELKSYMAVSYTHLTLPTIRLTCRCRGWGGE